jgi:hypothetical protein
MLSLSPSTVDFKTVDVGISSSVAFTVTNNGAADSGMLKIMPNPASSFQITNDRWSSVTLGKQGQCTFSLVFAPQAIGIVSATIAAQSVSGVTATSSATGVSTRTCRCGRAPAIRPYQAAEPARTGRPDWPPAAG